MRKGFTLIELLAVILILGIISLIAVPTVNTIIDESKKGAFENSVNNIIGAIEDNCQFQNLTGSTFTNTYTFTDGTSAPSINVKGSLPKSGSAYVDSDCNVTISVSNGTFVASKDLKEENISLESNDTSKIVYETYRSGTPVYFNPVLGTTCLSSEAVSTTETKSGCMKWYIYNDDSGFSSKVNLLLDHNTTATVVGNSSGSNSNGLPNALSRLKTDTSTWTGIDNRTDTYTISNGTSNYSIDYSTYKARLITANEVAKITSNFNFNELTSNEDGYFFFDSNSHTKVINSIGASKFSFLFDYTKICTLHGCNVEDASNSGYWTATTTYNEPYSAWFVSKYGVLDYIFVGDSIDIGIRPVITISKSSL